MASYQISIWCDYPGPESDLGSSLEQGELFEQASNVQYMIEEVTRG
jgi:hypothetical protein